jgi:ribosomal protein S18 acetylase RimI-like enzyme
MPFSDIPDAVFRRADISDAVAIRQLTRAVYAKYLPKMGRKPLTMSADQTVAIRDHQVWVLEVGGALTASIELIPKPDHLVVENVAVAKAQQGQGIGRRLMAFAEAETLRQQLVELRLYTNETMIENITLYESIGFTVTKRVPHRGTDIVYMAKQLA